MDVNDLLNENSLLPGDVVLDANNQRPMYVTGISNKDAEDVPSVWNSNVNRHKHDIDPDETVLELVDVPTGSHYFVPEEVNLYPEARLDPLLTQPATGERPPQQKVVRAVLSHLVADAYGTGHESVGDAILALAADNWSEEYVEEIREMADAESLTAGD